MPDFLVERGPPNVWGPFLEGRKMLQIGKALKFGGIFQKFGLIVLKRGKFMEKFQKNLIYQENFIFCSRCWEK